MEGINLDFEFHKTITAAFWLTVVLYRAWMQSELCVSPLSYSNINICCTIVYIIIMHMYMYSCRIVIEANHSLTFHDVQFADTAVYQCVAENFAGTAIDQTHLALNSKFLVYQVTIYTVYIACHVKSCQSL